MRLILACLIAAAAVAAAAGCSDTKKQTPPDISTEFYTLLDSLEDESIETAAGRLHEFVAEYGEYHLADTARAVLGRLAAQTDGRYHEARELARQGDFDQAESILQGLVTHFPGTKSGESADRYLQFEFYYGKAQWLLVRQRYEESGAVARALLEHDLTPFQTDQVEQILDNVGYVGAAYSESERFDAQNACRQLLIMLATDYAMEGQYPATLSLEEARARDPHSVGRPFNGLSALEDYRTSDRGASFVAVSKNGRHRIRVVEGEIQD